MRSETIKTFQHPPLWVCFHNLADLSQTRTKFGCHPFSSLCNHEGIWCHDNSRSHCCNIAHKKLVSETSSPLYPTGSVSGDTGPTMFLLQGIQRIAGFTDKFLVINGAAVCLTVVMTPKRLYYYRGLGRYDTQTLCGSEKDQQDCGSKPTLVDVGNFRWFSERICLR